MGSALRGPAGDSETRRGRVDCIPPESVLDRGPLSVRWHRLSLPRKKAPLRYLLIILCLASSTPPAGAQASFTGLGFAGSRPDGQRYSYAYAVSANGGVIVGTTTTPAGQEAFRWTTIGGMEALGDLPGGGVSSVAYSVSADGAVIAGDGRAGEVSRVFRWINGTMIDVGFLPGGATPRSNHGIVSPDGSVIVGYSGSNGCGEVFRWTEAGGIVGTGVCMRPMALTADGSVIVGEGAGPVEPQAIRLTGQVPESLLCLTGQEVLAQKSANAITPNGSIVVGHCRGGTRWTAAGVPSPLGTEFVPSGVSDDGTLIVGHEVFFNRAAIWDAGHGMRDLASVLESQYGLSLAGWTLEAARGISADGSTIVGQGIDPCGRYQAWAVRLTLPALPACPGDIDGDKRVTTADLTAFLGTFGTHSNCGDMNGDGIINTVDLIRLLGTFGRACN